MVSELRQDALDSAMHGASSSSSKSVLVSFSNSLSVRLDNNNYILWRRLILSTVRGHNLQRFIFGSKSPPEKFLALEDEDLGRVNPEFEIREQQRSVAMFVDSFFDYRGNSLASDQLRDFCSGMASS